MRYGKLACCKQISLIQRGYRFSITQLTIALRTNLLLIVCRNFNIKGIFINRDVEHIGVTAHLTVFNVRLQHPSADINEGRVLLAAKCTKVFCSCLHFYLLDFESVVYTLVCRILTFDTNKHHASTNNSWNYR
jgi:hypothetical protein